MNKADLIRKVATEVGKTQKDLTVLIDTIFNTITDTLASGEKVSIAGFGTFDVIERAAREGRNPKTNETIMIKASKAPKFKASSALKDAVNE